MRIIAELTEKAKQTRMIMIMMDVDGVLTDGRILYSSDGVEIEAFHVRDGVGLRAAHRAGLLTALLTGRVSPAVARREKELGLSEIHQGIPDKIEIYETLLRRYNLTDEAVAYIGDDLNDLPLLARAGLSAAPADAADEVKARVVYVTARGGGRGAARGRHPSARRSEGGGGVARGGISSPTDRESEADAERLEEPWQDGVRSAAGDGGTGDPEDQE